VTANRQAPEARRAGLIAHVAAQVKRLEQNRENLMRVVGPWHEPWRREIEAALDALPEMVADELDRLYLRRLLLTIWNNFPGADAQVAQAMIDDLEGDHIPGQHEQPCLDCDDDCRRLRVLLLPIARYMRESLADDLADRRAAR
jgi:hypothetical protein